MSDKRPWTPGPWQRTGHLIGDMNGRWWAKFASRKGMRQEAIDNAILASKAPELAEFVVKFVKGSHVQEHFDAIMLLSDLLDEAQKLLAECGYQEEDDEKE